MRQDIIQGDTLTELKKMADESIDCCITSPPYWALRAYGTTPQIWDGDSNCQHEWGNNLTTLTHKEGEINPGKEGWYKDKGASTDRGSNFCLKCNAWRGELGLEPTFELYIKHLIQIFDEIKRVLKKTGTCWVNLGDSYSGSGGAGGDYNPGGLREGQPKYKQGKSNVLAKSLCLIPQRFAIAMVDRGWICRNQIIWYKRNCMPNSVKDRFTVDYELIFFFVKSKKYWFEMQREENQTKYTESWGNFKRNKVVGQMADLPKSKKEFDKYRIQGRNRRCVWDITTRSFSGAHFATFPEALVEPMIKSGCPIEGIVLDPFAGAATTLVVAKKLGRNAIGIELNPAYVDMGQRRLDNTPGLLFTQTNENTISD